MERITYRITLDIYKNGIQRTLQGFETADNMARRLAINLTAGGDTFEIPLDHTVAMLYITTPSATEPSINECVIEDNTIIYDMLPITEEGITYMQLKLVETRLDGAKKVLLSPKFAVEVVDSNASDKGAEQKTTFTALENAIAKAVAVHEARLLNIEVDDDCTFRVFYADGTTYENDSLNKALYNGNAILSESYAKGGTGTREGEDTDNSMYFANVAKSTLLEAKTVRSQSAQIRDEVLEKTIYTTFSVNFETGELVYLSQNYNFTITEDGQLAFEGIGEWIPEDATKMALESLVTELTNTISTLEERVRALEAQTS